MSKTVKRVCKFCGAPFSIRKSEYERGRGKFCSKSCKGKYQVATNPPDQKGSKNSQYKGGRYLENGYVKVLAPDHPFKNGRYIFEHRLIMEKMIGRYLSKEERVHHINFIRDDNREENLLLVTKSEHSRLHWMLKKSGLKIDELPFEALRIITYNYIRQIRGISSAS